MSTYRATTAGDRVVLIHDMPGATVVSELDLVEADLLLEQLQRAVAMQIERRRESSPHLRPAF